MYHRIGGTGSLFRLSTSIFPDRKVDGKVTVDVIGSPLTRLSSPTPLRSSDEESAALDRREAFLAMRRVLDTGVVDEFGSVDPV